MFLLAIKFAVFQLSVQCQYHSERSCANAQQACTRWNSFLEKHGDASTINRLVSAAADRTYFRDGVLSGMK